MEVEQLMRFASDACDRLQVTYLVTGSTATIAYGEPRFTNDIDIVVDLPMEKADDFCAAFPMDDFYVNRDTVRDAVRRRTQFNVIHPASGLKIDFIVMKETAFNESRVARRRQLAILQDATVSFASPEDAILMKLRYYQEGQSEKHLRDIAGVLRVQGDRIDRGYVADWAKRLAVDDVWQMIVDRERERPGAENE